MRLLVLLLICLLGATSLAQIDPTVQFVTCEYHRAEIRQVLSDLFGHVEISFSMDDRIQGKVSVHLPPMQFEAALQTILSSSHLTYRCEGGVYQIIQRERSMEEQTWIDSHPYDQIQTTGLPEISATAIKAKNESVAELYRRVFSGSGQYYVIGTGIQDFVSVDLPRQSIGETLGFIARASRNELSYRSGVWIVSGPYEGPIF